MDGTASNQMTNKQSLYFWWAVAWRTILLGSGPILILDAILTTDLGFSNELVTILYNLLYIPVVIAVQKHVINTHKFSNFTVSVTKIKSVE